MLRFRQILVSASILVASAVSIVSCGQQGPLYLPAVPPAITPAAAPATAPANKATNVEQPDSQAPAARPAKAAPP